MEISPLSPEIRNALGLDNDTPYLMVKDHDAVGISTFRVEMPSKVAFHIVGITDELDKTESLPFLTNALDNSPTASAATCVSTRGRVWYSVRKNFRTGDFDYVGNSTAQPVANSSPSLWDLDLSSAVQPTPLTAKFENVLFEVHSALRDIDGMHAPEALDEICKLLVAKLEDERSGAQNFIRRSRETAEECAARARKLYLDATASSQKNVEQGGVKGIFKDPLFASSSAIARSMALLGPYDFSRTPMDIKGRAFQNVLLPAIRSGMGQYFTPKEVIDFIVKIMKPLAGEKIIDPFCGSGHFLTSVFDYVLAREPLHAEDCELHGIEKSDRMSRIAYMDFVLLGLKHCTVHPADALLPFDNYNDIKPGSFDLIVTNPPFGVDLTYDALQRLDRFELALAAGSSVSFEIVAIERCLQLLRPGGRLAIVLPDGVLTNKNTEHVRAWISKNANLRAIVSLPIQTFTPFGANIKTSIMVLTKRSQTGSPPPNVFLGIVEDVGYDNAGRLSPSRDLDELAHEFDEFINQEGW